MADAPGLFEVAVGFLEPFKDLLLGAGLSSLRLYAAFALLPPVGEKFLSGFLRQGVIGMLALYVGMGVPLDAIARLGPLELCGHAAKETMIGLMLGFAGAKVFWIAQSVGALIDTQAGFNNVQLTNPLSGQQSTPVSDLLLHVVVVVFFGMGGMLVLLGAIFDSFHVWPVVSSMPQWSRLPELFVIDQTESLMTGVVKFAAPMLLVLLLIDAGFGLVTRVAPKLELSSLGQPVKGAVTVLMLAILLGTLVSQIRYLLLPTALLAQLQATLGGSH
jgi:type III secretion protein T